MYANDLMLHSHPIDIGRPTLAGDAMETEPGNWTVMGAGNDIWVRLCTIFLSFLHSYF